MGTASSFTTSFVLVYSYIFFTCCNPSLAFISIHFSASKNNIDRLKMMGNIKEDLTLLNEVQTEIFPASAKIHTHGKHVMLDYTGFFVDAEEGGEFVMCLMREAVEVSGAREVHHKLVPLGLQGESPPGFTSVVLIDESHVTAHCYSDRGLLAIDAFTCGDHCPDLVATYIHEKLVERYPNTLLLNKNTVNRFHHFDHDTIVPHLQNRKSAKIKSN
mmetsp:Transcript_24416/g.30445  ORF Transcript_24416/g.30445 Transcript_24416/m.30445 type:complete len:216 (+) Transcript_24416:100-747(+)